MEKKLDELRNTKESLVYILKCVEIVDQIKNIVDVEYFDSKDAMNMIFEIKKLMGDLE